MAECRKIDVIDQTYYRWRKEYGGLKLDQVKLLKDLDLENSRLKKLVADLSLDIAILKEAAPGKLLSPSGRRLVVKRVCEKLAISERRACRVLEQPRVSQR